MKKKQFKKIELTENLLNEIVQKIDQGFHPLKIILFGSYAWGKPTSESDLDLLVVMESNMRPAQRACEVKKSCRVKFLPMDILVRTPQEIKNRLSLNDHFIKDIIDRGKVLYERPA